MIEYGFIGEMKDLDRRFMKRTKWLGLLEEFQNRDEDIMIIKDPKDVGCLTMAGVRGNIIKARNRFGMNLVITVRNNVLYVMKVK